MNGFQITITDAGRAEIINAENTGATPALIAEIGIGTGQHESPTLNARDFLNTPTAQFLCRREGS